jgi:hypothetical protein
VANPDRHFWPGQFVDIELILATARGAVLIPNQAAEISQQGPFVYVVTSESTTELRPVTLGQRQGDDVVVTSGVAAGERVVVTGQMTVVPGTKVQIQPGAPPAAPAGASTGAEKPQAAEGAAR